MENTSSKSLAVTTEKGTTEKGTTEKTVWSGVPEPPAGWKWESKSRVLFQSHSRNYYLVPEVVSSLEKSILAGNIEDAFYWTIEYATMGDQFVMSAWSHLFLLAANSIGPADPSILPYMWDQFNSGDKAYQKLSSVPSGPESGVSVGGTEPEDDPEQGESSSDNNCVDPHRLTFLLETVRRLCLAPKTRTVDSIVRTFLMPYPSNCPLRPYEPFHDQVHLPISADNMDSSAEQVAGIVHLETQLRSLSYVANYEEGVPPVYTLFQLQESDPPYLAPWANALVHLLNQIRAFDLSADGQEAIQKFQTLERAVFYFAGLIYQCTEPAPHNKKLNATYILWELIQNFNTEETTELLSTLRKISDEISKHDNRRERPFLAMALLLTVRPWCLSFLDTSVTSVDADGDSAMPLAPLAPPTSPTTQTAAIDLASLFEQNANELLEVNVNALDYTTAEGKLRRHTVSDYLLTAYEIIEQSPYDSGLPDMYRDIAYQLERAREAAHMKDLKKVIESHVPFFRFLPEGPMIGAASDTGLGNNGGGSSGGGGRRKAKPVDSFKLTQFYTLPLNLFSSPNQSQEGTFNLPWRGQFIPYLVDPQTLTSIPHPFETTFFDVQPVVGNKGKEGLFLATYKHAIIGAECDVFFIPCPATGVISGAKQVFYQCLLDELKPLFGVPSLGTHCLYVDHVLEKIDKKAEWTKDNFIAVPNRGCHVVMFPVTAFGFDCRTTAESTIMSQTSKPFNFQNFTVESLSTPMVKKSKAPFLTTDFSEIRQQVINIFLFYICLGVSKGSLSRMLLVSTNGLIEVSHKEFKDETDENGAVSADTPPEAGEEMLEMLARASKAKVVPFYELVAFTNQPFPEIMSKLRQTLVRSIWINDQAYVMVRFFNLMLNLDWDGIEIVLQRFGAPAVEWTGVIRTNLRDFRSSWLLWSMHSEASQLVQRQKNQVKNRERLERKRQAKAATPKNDSIGPDEPDEADASATTTTNTTGAKKKRSKTLKAPPDADLTKKPKIDSTPK